ncbi:DoxX family protein [Halococcus saccharolyticus]|uniref:DoxX family protein n=1 Tax=Halococcus saccharolyticus DSM 5350 TaxID=1227455 RepID=M0MQP6_9EURY|nr:DoxX family protein [Halococcus saccharolyticus]EMA48027.1 DoxX family protein [Halococcus saccharolyticus DSM 5350]
MSTQNGSNWSGESVGLAFSRLALGIIFVVSGVGKVFAMGPKASGIDAFAGMLAQLGVPLPTVTAWGVGVLELVGGGLLLIGLLTRLVAALLAVDMAVATVLVHLPNGFVVSDGGYEYTFVLTLSALGLALSGPGVLSVRRALTGSQSSTSH